MKSFSSCFLASSLLVTAAVAQEAKAPAQATDLPVGIEHVQTLDGIEEYRLSRNGLHILLMPNEGLPVASVMVTYQVGSRNEVTGTTGATHILEHMMFKGTEKYNSVDGTHGPDYSTQMERIGARSNATTYFDRTNYFAVLPSEYVPLAIELEADRMRNLRITQEDLDSEMTVVRNEYERGENNPVRTLIKEIYASAFIAQPYGHPVIGWLSDIENTSPEKLRRFYDIYYWPENTYLTVIGGFDRASTLEAIVEYYDPIPKAPAPIPTVDTIEPEQLGPRRVVIERSGQVGVVAVAFKVPEGAHEDWPALWLLEQLIGADKTGRLYRALEDKGKASATFTFAPQLRDPSLFFFAAYMTPDATHQETEAIMLEEIQKVIKNGVDEDELARAKSVIQANTVYGRDGPYAIADQINEAIAMGDWTSYVTLPKAIQDVTAADVQRVAARYFVERSSTSGWFVPQTSPMARIERGRIHGPNYFRDPEIFGPEHKLERTPENVPPAQPTEINFSEQMQHATIGEIELIAIDMPIENVVSFVGSFAAGETHSPVDAPTLAGLTAAMLDKGTERNDRFAIAERLDSLGADLSFSAGAHSLGFSGKFLSANAGVVMNLLAEQLRQPAFDPEVLETVKTRQKASLLRALESPDYRADARMSRLLYPERHPNYTHLIKNLIEDVETTTIEDIQQFHAEHYGPKSMLLVFAGDIKFEQLTAAVETAFADWTGGVDYPITSIAPNPNAKRTERIQLTDKPSVSIRYAFNTELQRTDPDYLPFMVGNYILGGSFHSRLMSEVRKERGLTYDIRSSHTGDIMTPGNWSLAASFAPSMLEDGLAATDAVLRDWFQEGVSDEEVNAAVQTLSGLYMVRLSTTGSVAGQVHSFVQRGLAPDYVDQYPELLREINAESVNSIVQKHLDPKSLSVVLAGTLSESTAPSTPGPQAQSQTRKLTVRLDTPNAGWGIEIQKVYRVADTLAVISQLTHSGDSAAEVISTVADSVSVPETGEDLQIRHYVLGKTWNWGESENTSFIESMDALGGSLDGAELLYSDE